MTSVYTSSVTISAELRRAILIEGFGTHGGAKAKPSEEKGRPKPAAG